MRCVRKIEERNDMLKDETYKKNQFHNQFLILKKKHLEMEQEYHLNSQKYKD
jgi:hypothetical protein